MIMRKLLNYLRDIFIAILLGFGLGLVLLVILYLIGLLFGGHANGITVVRSGLLMIGGFLLIFSAILILKSGHLPKSAFKLVVKNNEDNKDEDLSTDDELKEKFKKIFIELNKSYVALFFAAGILLLAGIVDYFMWLAK